MLKHYQSIKDWVVFPNQENALTVSGQPVLIDFANNGIFKREHYLNFQPLVHRGGKSRLRSLAKMIVTRRRGVSEANIDAVCSLERFRGRTISVLIIGGGVMGRACQRFYTEEAFETVSFDVFPSELTTFVADAHRIPLQDGLFDLVIIQTVLEHVLDPAQVVAEIYRVLKVGGIVYSETPFMQQVHEGAYDFTRFTESGHRWLFRDFHCLESGALRGCGTQLMWSINYFIAGLFRSRMIGQASKLLYFWLQYLDDFCGARQTVDGCSETFFLGEKKEEKPVVDIIAYYQGAQKGCG